MGLSSGYGYPLSKEEAIKLIWDAADRTTRIFSSAEKCRRVARRM
jgi:hypothetical protein